MDVKYMTLLYCNM